MKLKFNLIAGAAISSVVSLSAFAQVAPIHDGSIGSRAPLPSQLPSQYSAVTAQNANGSGSQTTLVANHIGAPASDQAIAAVAPAPQTYVIAQSATEPVLPPTGRTIEVAGASLGATQMSEQIRSNATATPEQLKEIEARVAVSEKAMATTRSTMPALSAEGQEKFAAANSDAKAKEQTLQQSIGAARNATSEQVATTSEQVAGDFVAYAAAVNKVDTLAADLP